MTRTNKRKPAAFKVEEVELFEGLIRTMVLEHDIAAFRAALETHGILRPDESFGLFYLIGLSLIVVAYVFWPSNKKQFDDAAESILRDEDVPWR